MAIFVTKSSSQTKKIGSRLMLALTKKRLGKQAVIVELSGDLGSGKTAFVQGAGQAVGIKKGICSPTFVIFRKYEIKKSKSSLQRFYHFDCYRLEGNQSKDVLGIKEIFSDSKNVVFIEWPENIKKFVPKNTIKVSFVNQGGSVRQVKMKSKV